MRSAAMTRVIPLKGCHVALVDDSDWPLVSTYRWYLRVDEDKWMYARGIRRVEGRTEWVLLHQLIMNPEPGEVVDHRNHNGLDNQRSNLRVCSLSENNGNARLSRNNTSGYKGVSWNARCGKWRAQIKVRGKKRHLGQFHTPEEAARAYDAASRAAWGEFACTNEDLAEAGSGHPRLREEETMMFRAPHASRRPPEQRPAAGQVGR